MIRKSDDHVQWLEFELLQEIPGLVHGVFLRHGGVSQGPFSSLNVSDYRGDQPFFVQTNRKKIARALGLPRLASANQVHGKKIGKINSKEPCDGLIGAETNVGFLIQHADCQAAIVVDPVKRVIANVHCGWRGNVQNIYAEVIRSFCEEYKSRPEDLRVAVSPSLGPDNSEFKNYQTELPESFWPYQIKPTYFDLWSIAEDQLKSAGILPHHIQIARLCTFANSEDYFSYRRDKQHTGNHATVVAWKS